MEINIEKLAVELDKLTKKPPKEKAFIIMNTTEGVKAYEVDCQSAIFALRHNDYLVNNRPTNDTKQP